ncbi:unnamed protein product, partial [Didymodactylos carnosus]
DGHSDRVDDGGEDPYICGERSSTTNICPLEHTVLCCKCNVIAVLYI